MEMHKPARYTERLQPLPCGWNIQYQWSGSPTAVSDPFAPIVGSLPSISWILQGSLTPGAAAMSASPTRYGAWSPLPVKSRCTLVQLWSVPASGISFHVKTDRWHERHAGSGYQFHVPHSSHCGASRTPRFHFSRQMDSRFMLVLTHPCA